MGVTHFPHLDKVHETENNKLIKKEFGFYLSIYILPSEGLYNGYHYNYNKHQQQLYDPL